MYWLLGVQKMSLIYGPTFNTRVFWQDVVRPLTLFPLPYLTQPSDMDR